MGKKVLLTGDRPTGRLHLGHYMGTLHKRLELQKEFTTYIMIADTQALTDYFDDVERIRSSIFEVCCDYLAVGINPEQASIFIQSEIKELFELSCYLMNVVTINRIGQNPTVKNEIKLRGFNNEGIPAGFYLYPLYQVSDIVAFRADVVPVGMDQKPMVELARDVVRKFQTTYKSDALIVPEGVYPKQEKTLPGIDGRKMSKSLGNAIYLSDTADEIQKKVRKMKSDPSRLKIEDPGDPEKAVVFSYLDFFDPDQKELASLKDQYREGGLADKVLKERLVDVLDTFLTPIRKKRAEIAQDPEEVYKVLRKGTGEARKTVCHTMAQVRRDMGINYDFLQKSMQKAGF